MEKVWETNRFAGKNPSHTAGFFNSYDTREFTAEQVVAREAPQNAMDAGRGVKGATRIEFHKLIIEGQKKQEFLSIFEFRHLLESRVEALRLNPRNNQLAENLNKFFSDQPLSMLLIRDFNTCGLGGDWQQYRPKIDHFARLVCATNLDDKADNDPQSGGSFGLGKTSYAKSSSINTVIYHSVFKGTQETKNKTRRLMVAGVYPRHKLEDIDYGGFAYFGEPNPENPVEAKPFEDESATELWEEISSLSGRDLSRKPNEYGTDVLILMDSLDLLQIRTAVEDYYFPAIIDGRLTAKFVEADGNVEFPQPHKRKDLDQFIRLMDKAQIGNEEKAERLEVGRFKKRLGHNLGAYAFEAAEPDEAGTAKNNCVAIMRGTGMIINYLKLGSEKYESAVGVFCADSDIHTMLIESENAAHSEWNANSYRLRDAYPEQGKPIVMNLNSVLSSRFQQFQKALQPDVSKTRTESGLLAKILAAALTGNSGDDDVPPGKPNPVGISLQKKKREDDISVWRLQVHPNEHTPDQPFELKILPSISLAGDRQIVAIKHMEFRVKNSDGQLIVSGIKPELKFQYERGMIIDLGIEYDNPGRKNYVVQAKFEALVEG